MATITKYLALLATLSVAGAAEKLTPIFDGKTLNGWNQCNGSAKYYVENGELVGVTAKGSPNSFLCSEKEYGDFILEFEVKDDPALNSGVQIRSHRYQKQTEVMTENKGKSKRTHEAGRVHGYQVEIASEESGASGGIYEEAGRGWLANVSSDPVASKAFHDNQWNKFRVVAIGDSIKTWINGVPCADLVDAADQSGFIGLQVHQFPGENPAQVRWRNIRLEDLGRAPGGPFGTAARWLDGRKRRWRVDRRGWRASRRESEYIDPAWVSDDGAEVRRLHCAAQIQSREGQQRSFLPHVLSGERRRRV